MYRHIIVLVVLLSAATCQEVSDPPTTQFQSQTEGQTQTQTEEPQQQTQSEVPQQTTDEIRDRCPAPKPISCVDVYKSGSVESGVYEIWPVSRVHSGPIKVYCDMKTSGGGWTVLAQLAGIYSNRSWAEYKKGFGSFEDVFFLGNDNIFGLSNQRKQVIKFAFTNSSGDDFVSYVFNDFYIASEFYEYEAYLGDYCFPTEENPPFRTGSKFSTYDQDNDAENDINCASEHKAWWYKYCRPKDLDNLYFGGLSKYSVEEEVIYIRLAIRDIDFHLEKESCESYFDDEEE